MKRWLGIGLCAALIAGVDLPARTQTTTQPPLTGAHPESHGPNTTPAAQAEAPPQLTVTAKHRPRYKRPRWRTTAGHRSRCKRRFRSYNPRTNRYVARSGVMRRCVL